MVGNNDDARSGDKPERIEAEERVVEAALLRIVLQREKRWVDEHAPACGPEEDQSVPSPRLVDVQHLDVDRTKSFKLS